MWIQLGAVLLTAALIWVGMLLQTKNLWGKAKERCRRRALWVIFLYYVLLIVVLLFFGGLLRVDRSYEATVNLTPFLTIQSYLRHYAKTGSFVSAANLLGNIALLFPMGMLLPLLLRPMGKLRFFLPLAAAVSFGIEFIQWLTRTGAADIDDSILNFAGALCGFAAVKIGQKIFGAETKR